MSSSAQRLPSCRGYAGTEMRQYRPRTDRRGCRGWRRPGCGCCSWGPRSSPCAGSCARDRRGVGLAADLDGKFLDWSERISMAHSPLPRQYSRSSAMHRCSVRRDGLLSWKRSPPARAWVPRRRCDERTQQYHVDLLALAVPQDLLECRKRVVAAHRVALEVPARASAAPPNACAASPRWMSVATRIRSSSAPPPLPAIAAR